MVKRINTVIFDLQTMPLPQELNTITFKTQIMTAFHQKALNEKKINKMLTIKRLHQANITNVQKNMIDHIKSTPCTYQDVTVSVIISNTSKKNMNRNKRNYYWRKNSLFEGSLKFALFNNERLF